MINDLETECRVPTKDNPFMNPSIHEFSNDRYQKPKSCPSYNNVGVQNRVEELFNKDLRKIKSVIDKGMEKYERDLTLDEVKALNEGISFEKGVFASMLFGDDETIDAEKIKEDINSVKEEVNAATDEIIEKEKENQGTKKETEKIEKSAHQKRIEQNLESAIIQGQSAKQAGVSVIKAEVAKSTAALITKIMQNVPFPLNLAIAAGAGSMIGQVTDQLFSSFATGGSFITKGRTTLPIGSGVVVGDNASGMERIDVTPLPAPPTTERNITINISAPLVDETVVDTIIPAIRRAEKLNL